jgi:hypothetical protein
MDQSFNETIDGQLGMTSVLASIGARPGARCDCQSRLCRRLGRYGKSENIRSPLSGNPLTTRSAKSTPCSSGAGQNCACHVAFQPPDFYTKRGYGVFGRLDDYPPGHAKLFLYKRLSVPPG